MRDDFALLDAWADGDPRAADELFGRYFDPLYRFFSTKAPAAVEDLVQDTFAIAVKSHTRFRREGSFRGFLFGTARNVLFRHYRAQRFRNHENLGEASVVDLDPSPSSLLVRKREERLLLEGLRRIPLDYQIAIELYDWEGMSGPEVAQTLGMSEAGFRSRLYRAKEALKHAMAEIAGEDGVLESTVAGLEGWARSLREQLGRAGEP